MQLGNSYCRHFPRRPELGSASDLHRFPSARSTAGLLFHDGRCRLRPPRVRCEACKLPSAVSPHVESARVFYNSPFAAALCPRAVDRLGFRGRRWIFRPVDGRCWLWVPAACERLSVTLKLFIAGRMDIRQEVCIRLPLYSYSARFPKRTYSQSVHAERCISRAQASWTTAALRALQTRHCTLARYDRYCSAEPKAWPRSYRCPARYRHLVL